MRSTIKLFRLVNIGSGCVTALAMAAVQAQSLEPRYGMPPSTDVQAMPPADAPPSGEPLLSYRREDPADATSPAVDTAPAMKEPRLTSSATLDDSNPLRKTAEPAAAPQTVFPSASMETAPIHLALPEPAPVVAADAGSAALASPIPPALSNPFPPGAQLPESPAAISPPPIAEPLTRYDAAVQPAVHEAEISAPETANSGLPMESSTSNLMSRRLAPADDGNEPGDSKPSAAKSSPLPFAFSKLESFTTAGAGLAIVIGLFLICVWSLRRGGGKTGGVLPADVFTVLGRAPLTPQSFAHLLRLGNKLVLVAMSSDGIQPLTEVTDPLEVDRITGLCTSGRGYGPSAEFKQVLAHLAKEPARGFLGAEASEGGRRR